MIANGDAGIGADDYKLNLKGGAFNFGWLESVHTTEAARGHLSAFLALCNAKAPGRELRPTLSVTDHSAVLLNAVSIVFNGKKLHHYVTWTAALVRGELRASEIKSQTQIYICALHTLKLFPLPVAKRAWTRRRNHRIK